MLVMPVKTFGTGLRFVLFLSLLPITSSNLWAKAHGSRVTDASEIARITISVYNDAEVPADVLERAQNEASQVFRQAGIEVHWLNCKVPAISEEASRACREAVFPQHLHLRIVRKSIGLTGETLGISFQADDGSGCYADLFYKPMEQLRRSDGTDIAGLLGHAAAHEIGHLLLGANSHSATGIMHAHWTADELASAKAGGLVFLEKESQRMKVRLATPTHGSKKASLASTAAIPARTGE
jgi:hypothetical protein